MTNGKYAAAALPAAQPDHAPGPWPLQLAGGRVFDLGRELTAGVPCHPSNPPFMHRLARRPGVVVDSRGLGALHDVIVTGTHVGTHIDGLGHIYADGAFGDGTPVASAYDDSTGGLTGPHGVENVRPMVVPAVLADVPRARGTDALPDDYLISAEELRQVLEGQGTPIPESGALLIRTGWGRDWPHVAGLTYEASPGPGEEAIAWAWEQGARLFGSDTLSFERFPAASLPVHRFLLLAHRAHIIEAMDLEELSANGVTTFVLVVAPLKLRGATASPVRPVAIAAASPEAGK